MIKGLAYSPSAPCEWGIFTIDKSRALKYLGHLTPEEMRRVDDAVRISLALNPMGSIKLSCAILAKHPRIF